MHIKDQADCVTDTMIKVPHGHIQLLSSADLGCTVDRMGSFKYHCLIGSWIVKFSFVEEKTGLTSVLNRFKLKTILYQSGEVGLGSLGRQLPSLLMLYLLNILSRMST